jgi:DNA-binding Lrp family transcriptional regulator
MVPVSKNPSKERTMETGNRLRILWYLKEHGPLLRQGGSSPLTRLAHELGLSLSGCRKLVLDLETDCLVMRTHRRTSTGAFGSERGNPIERLELLDPKIALPPKPKPLPEFVVVARENEQLAEMTAHEPTVEDMVMALVRRNTELQEQIDKMQVVIEKLAGENDQLKKDRPTRRVASEHLTQTVRAVLPAEQWDALRGKR